MRHCGWAVAGTAVVTTSLLVVAGAALVLRGGVSARTEPSALEAALARRVRRLAIPGSAQAATNPIPSGDEVVAAARAHFADHCASCHGNDGGGKTALGTALYPRPPDLRAAATQTLSDGELFYVIENGVRLTGMPGFGGAARPEESWKLVHFIRHLPAQTKEEVLEMERQNPRSAAEWRELQGDDAFLGGAASEPEPPPGGHTH